MRLLVLAPPLPAALAAALEAVQREGLGPHGGGDADPGLVAGDASTVAAWLARRDPRLHAAPLAVVFGSAEACTAALLAGADLALDPAEPGDLLAARVRALLRRVTAGAARGLGLDLEFERAQRYRRCLALAMIACPREGASAAERIRPLVRDVDTLVRLAPARLGLVLPETGAQGALALARRLADALGADTAIGLAAYPGRGIDGPRALLGRAGEALVQAQQGPDRVVAFGAADVVWSREAPDPAPL